MPTPQDAPYKVQQRNLKNRLRAATKATPPFPFVQRLNPARAAKKGSK